MNTQTLLSYLEKNIDTPETVSLSEEEIEVIIKALNKCCYTESTYYSVLSGDAFGCQVMYYDDQTKHQVVSTCGKNIASPLLYWINENHITVSPKLCKKVSVDTLNNTKETKWFAYTFPQDIPPYLLFSKTEPIE